MRPPDDYSASLTALHHKILQGDPTVESYTENYWGGHRLALHNMYPCIKLLMVEKHFNALAQVYIQQYPPESWDLNLYGAQFYELLYCQQFGAKADSYHWLLLAVIAQIECGISTLYYANSDECNQDTVEYFIENPVDKNEEMGLYRGVNFSVVLGRCHPYADIEGELILTQPIVISRNGLRLFIENIAMDRL